MFRFVYALNPGETWDPTLLAEGIAGVECDGPPPEGVVRLGGGTAAAEGYVIHPPVPAPAYGSAAGQTLLAAAERQPQLTHLFENGGAFTTAWDLWTVLEAAHHPSVALALDIDTARSDGQTAAVLVPTLNLRIGLVRVRSLNDEVTAYARRLAGIGFDGMVVLDPPAGPGRVQAARAMAGVVIAVLPIKVTKKAATAKAGATP